MRESGTVAGAFIDLVVQENDSTYFLYLNVIEDKPQRQSM